MTTDTEYYKLMTENYDLSRYEDRRKILFANEAQKNARLGHLAMNLYKHIRENITEIDFGTIPKSKGDITKIENYEQMMDCLNTINDIVKSYKDPTKLVNEIYTAIDNIDGRKKDFSKAFALNIEFPVMLYNMSVMSVVSAISLLITTSIEFIKNGHDSFTASFDKSGFKRSKDHLLFEYITQFNRNCKNGTIDKLIEVSIKNNMTATKESANVLKEDSDDIADIFNAVRRSGPVGLVAISCVVPGPWMIVGWIVALGMIAFNFFKLISKVIGFYYKFSTDISDWFALQAEFLRINAENLKYREDDHTDSQKKEIYQSQMKWVARFNKASNFFAIKDSKIQKEIKEEEKQEEKRRPPEDEEIESENQENQNPSRDEEDGNQGSNDGDLF